MCGWKIFKTNALAWVSENKSGRCRVTAKLSTEFLSPENLFGSQKSGRFGVRLIVARSSLGLLITVLFPKLVALSMPYGSNSTVSCGYN